MWVEPSYWLESWMELKRQSQLSARIHLALLHDYGCNYLLFPLLATLSPQCRVVPDKLQDKRRKSP